MLCCSIADEMLCLFARYSRLMLRTKDVSLGSTFLLFTAWHVNTEFKSWRPMAGQDSLFSMTSPVLCSYSSSTRTPFTNHRTVGSGRPIFQKNKHKIKLNTNKNHVLSKKKQ